MKWEKSGNCPIYVLKTPSLLNTHWEGDKTLSFPTANRIDNWQPTLSFSHLSSFGGCHMNLTLFSHAWQPHFHWENLIIPSSYKVPKSAMHVSLFIFNLLYSYSYSYTYTFSNLISPYLFNLVAIHI